jgi:signal transduction histidine kinase
MELAPLNLASRIVLSLLVPVLVCLGTFGVLNVRLLRAEMLDDARRELRDHATSLSVAMGAAMRDRQIEDIAELADDLSRADRVLGVVIFDENDRLIRASRALQSDVARLLPLGHAARTETSRVSATHAGNGRPVLVYGFALRARDGDRPSGSALLLRDLTYIEQNIRSAEERVALVGVITALSLIIAAWLGLRSSVLHPISLLLQSVQEAKLDPALTRAPVVREDEIGLLAGRFNELLDSLRSARASLEERTQAMVSLERRLHHAQRLALVGQLAANLAHKVGSPLNVILGRARYALQQGGQSDRDKRHLQEIVAGAENISAVIEQLLSHARKGRGQLGAVDVSEVATSVARFVEVEAQARAVQIELDCDEPAWITASREEVEQVCINLVMNALQAQPNGGRVRVRTVRVAGAPSMIELTVEDVGPGVAVDDRLRVFEAFYTTKEGTEGTGLGLAICEEITQRLGGTITVGDASIGGACFTVRVAARTTNNAEEPS